MEIGTYKVKDNEIDKHNYTYKNMTDEEIKEQAEKHKRNTSIIDAGYSFVRGAEWARQQAEKECPTYEQYRKIVLIFNGAIIKEEWVKADYDKLKEHWND